MRVAEGVGVGWCFGWSWAGRVGVGTRAWINVTVGGIVWVGSKVGARWAEL